MAKLVFVAVVSVLFAACYGERMVGAPRELSVDDKGLQEALRFAMYEYNKGSNDMYQSRLGKVHNATMQLVNGYKYDMNVEVRRTKCKKPTTDVNGCPFHEDPTLAKAIMCHFTVVNRMWASKIFMDTVKCQ
ncbi:cystatin-like [Rana temporaria]|uniref:cystatin-like n=1 Tax=Rana temporaria TaxID=8407 RepID=UPI001AAC6774|nr:cystatin-like [Rana temporaria]